MGAWVGGSETELIRWLDDAYERHFASGKPSNGDPTGEVVIDGTQVVDLLTMYCAFGEAINGPGGYFGRNLDAFDDCLFGGFGLKAPCVIVWKDSAVSRARFDAAGKARVFEEVVEIIATVSERAGKDSEWSVELRLE
ncbi:MAG: barstar family protein [Myxococcota bacterium]